jgi:hypothetical protein
VKQSVELFVIAITRKDAAAIGARLIEVVERLFDFAFIQPKKLEKRKQELNLKFLAVVYSINRRFPRLEFLVLLLQGKTNK